MGKKRIEKLLETIKDNQKRETINAAGIYTVAQVAINKIVELETGLDTKLKTELETKLETKKTSSPPFRQYTVEELKAQYPKLADCRKALKERGLVFSKTPSWAKVAIALSYFEVQQAQFYDYLRHRPSPELTHLTMTFRPEEYH